MLSDSTNTSCNFQESPVTDASELRSLPERIIRKFFNKLFTLKGHTKRYVLKRMAREEPELLTLEQTNLQPGDWVQIRSMKEIASTLDEKGKCSGLYFMPEMEQFCGKRFRIFKVARNIKLETNGQLRRLKNPSYFLENVFCTGEHQGGCDRSCFHYWREAWLTPVDAPK